MNKNANEKEHVVAFVPLRLNNERVPGKNLRDLGGKPLLHHLLATLTQVSVIDEVIAYCSDPTVADHLPSGVTLRLRDPELDGNTVKGLQIYRAFARDVAADIYVLAHATSPFLRGETVARGVAAVLGGEYDSALTVQRHQTFAWYRDQPLNYPLTDVPRTQDIEPVFVETSSYYIYRREVLVDHGRRVGTRPLLVEVDPVEAVDIDTESDLRFAEQIHAALQTKPPISPCEPRPA